MSRSGDEVLTRPAAGPDLVLRYAGHDEAVIDVFLPASTGTAPAPRTPQLLVLLHGGFWRQRYDRRHLRPLANAVRERGLAVAVPEYRRVGGAGGWPTTAYDVEAALRDLPAMLDGVAPGRADVGAPFVLCGHSAGGHLAMWAGLRAGPARVSAIVGLAPVSDLVYAAQQRLGDGAVQELLGGEPDDVPETYAAAGVDPSRLLASGIRLTIIQGGADDVVPAEMNRQLRGTVFGSEASLSYTELDGVEHFALIDPLTPAFDEAVWPALAQP
ncbi:MAG: alpha/beta hydrolase family protein [Nocardioidaceae bacterium]